LTPKSHVRAVRYRKLALAEPPLKGTAMKAPSVSVTALYVGLLAHASKTDPYMNVSKTDPHLAHVAVRDLKIWKWLAP
jgi:hypothetical protein